jgi:hypothetical protein
MITIIAVEQKKTPKTLLGAKQVTQLGYLGSIVEVLMANTPIA